MTNYSTNVYIYIGWNINICCILVENDLKNFIMFIETEDENISNKMKKGILLSL